MDESVVGRVLFIWAELAVGGYLVWTVFRRTPITSASWSLTMLVAGSVLALGLIGALTGALEGADASYAMPIVFPAIFLRNLQVKADREP